MKCETVLSSHLSPLQSSLPFVQLIIALEETIHMISIYPPGPGREKQDEAQRDMDRWWLLKLKMKFHMIKYF